MPRTGSMASKVGPAVTITRRPASSLGCSDAITSSHNSSASSMRPSPISPQAWSPLAGPSTSAPSARMRATLRCVAGCAHISRFMAGATSSGQRSIGRARQARLSKSSADPLASLAMKSADAGATISASAARVRPMCAMLLGSRVSHWLVNTGRPLSACIVTAVMNASAACVITTCTVAPALTSSRVNSAAL